MQRVNGLSFFWDDGSFFFVANRNDGAGFFFVFLDNRRIRFESIKAFFWIDTFKSMYGIRNRKG